LPGYNRREITAEAGKGNQMAMPHSTGSIREHPSDWVFWFLASLWTVAVFFRVFGWWGILVALLVSACLAYLCRRHHFLYPLWRLPEIGPVEMVLAECRPSGTFSRDWARRVYLIAGGIFLIMFWIDAYVALTSAPPEGTGVAIWDITQKLLGLLGYGAILYVGYRNLAWQLVVAGEGLFRLIDPKRPWITNADVREPNSRLRARRIYSWEQIEGFHFSSHPNTYRLHLSVRVPSISVPQLISYELPSLSEADRQHLEELLRSHVPVSANPREPVAV
jgi:hypothetical protein